MKEPGNIERDMALLNQELVNLKEDHRESIAIQKETNRSTQELTTQIARMCDKFDALHDGHKEVKKKTEANTSRLDKYENTMKIVQSVIAALILGFVAFLWDTLKK